MISSVGVNQLGVNAFPLNANVVDLMYTSPSGIVYEVGFLCLRPHILGGYVVDSSRWYAMVVGPCDLDDALLAHGMD